MQPNQRERNAHLGHLLNSATVRLDIWMIEWTDGPEWLKMTRGWEVGVRGRRLGWHTGLGQRVWVSINRKTDKRIKSRTGGGCKNKKSEG